MNILNQQLSDDRPAAPGLGLRRPAFGLSREKVNRLELVLAMRGGGLISVFEELDREATPEVLQAYAQELAAEIAAGKTRTFADATTATGQHSWVSLGEVTAFTVRQAK